MNNANIINKDENMRNIQSENKKAFGTLAVILFVAMIGGGIAGVLFVRFHDNLKSVLVHGVDNIMRVISPYAITVCSVILLGAALLILQHCKRELARHEDDDAVLDRVEYRISYPLALASVCMIIDFFFLPASMIYAGKSYYPTLFALISFIVSVACIMWIQQKAVDMEKQMNPEKKGSVYEMKFAEKWEESCDEAQRLNIYKSAYVSYQVTTKAFVGVWLVVVFGSLFFDTGILPVAVVTILWLIQTLSYCFAAMKLEKSR